MRFLYDYFIGGGTLTLRRLGNWLSTKVVESRQTYWCSITRYWIGLRRGILNWPEDLSLLIRVGQITGYEAVDYYKSTPPVVDTKTNLSKRKAVLWIKENVF